MSGCSWRQRSASSKPDVRPGLSTKIKVRAPGVTRYPATSLGGRKQLRLVLAGRRAVEYTAAPEGRANASRAAWAAGMP